MMKKILSWLLALALLAGLDICAAAAEVTEPTEPEIAMTITQNGEYKLEEETSGVIVISAGVSEVVIEGSGVQNPVTLDCTAAAGIQLTLRDVDLKAESGSVLDFSGEGNRLTITGTCLVDSGSKTEAAVHVTEGTALTIDGDGVLYLHQDTENSVIGGNEKETGGSLTMESGALSIEGGSLSGTVNVAGGSIRADWAEDAMALNPDGERLYPCAVDLSEVTADSYTVSVDETEVYSGPGYAYVYDSDGWKAQQDQFLYVLLTGEDHLVSVNETEYTYYWDELYEVFSLIPHATVSFSVSPSNAQVVVSSGIGYTYTEQTYESLTVDAMTKFSLTPGNYTATITKDGCYASQFSFQVTEERKVTSIDTSSNVKNYLDDSGVFTITLGTFKKSSNSGAWDGVTLDVSWYSENASEMEISTPAQLAGMAAIVNGIYNAEITTIIDDTNGDGKTETYTPEAYAALTNRKIIPVCVGEDANRVNADNQVTTSSYWYGAKSSGTFAHGENELPLPADFNGQTIYITADLDMGGYQSGSSWTGARYMTIGGQSLMHYIDYAAKESDGYSHIGSSFNGHLEGQGHIIRNIYCDRDASGSNYGDSSSIGLIGRLGNHDNDPNDIAAVDPSVRDLAVHGYIYGRRSVGGIVGKIGKTSASNLKDGSTGGIIENCLNFCEIRNTDAKGVGGICGAAWNKGLIQNCANFGYIYAAYKNAGGISGSCEVNVVNCYNVGYVDAVSIDYAQAIATDNGGAVFTNCYWLTGSSYADSDDSYSYPAVYKNDSKDTITEITSFEELAGEAFLEDLNGDGRDWTTASGSDGINALLTAVSFENCKLSTSGVTAEGFPVPRAFVSDTASTTKIEKISDPEKLSYVEGESFDPTGLQIRATYSDGTTELLTDYTVTPSGALKTSDTSVTVSGERNGVSYSYEFAITVTGREVVEIVIKTAPANTIYASDEEIDLSGMEVAAYYTDAPETEVILAEDEYTTSLSGDQLTVRYTYNGDTVTASMTFTRLSSPAPEKNSQGYYELNCADDLTWFANQVTNVKNTAINGLVTADITADGIFMGIGKSGAYYAGTFDGGNYTITLNMSTEGTAGLFTGVSGAVIRNVTVAGSVTSTSASSGIAGLVGYVGTGGVTVENCVNEAAVTGGGYVGGIIGKTASAVTVVTDCENRGAISGSVDYAGGICGYVTKDVTITGCTNSGTVSGVGCVGGIVGYANGSDADALVRIERCGNDGAVSGTTSVGGILGYSESEWDEIVSCYNAASVKATALAGNSGVGGIAGFFAGQMDSCYNCGTVSCTGNAVSNESQSAGVGGLTGLAYACDIANSYNSGSLSGDGSGYVKLGGIVGYVYYGESTASNTYYLEADSLSADGGAINTSSSLTGDYASKTSAELMALAETLGSNFQSNGDESYHGGYPVLAWENVDHVHVWDEGTVTTVATCTENGEKTYTCICGETKTESIEATGHSWDEGVITTEATCTEAGEKTYTCSNCGETYTETIDAIGHAWDEGVVTREPTETEAGEKTYTCGNCGETRTESIDPVGHTWDEGTVTKEPTCTEPGEKTYRCTDEGCEITKTEEIAALGHAWDEGTVTKEPTCTEAGEKTISCTNGCGETQTEKIEALGHAWDEGIITKEPSCSGTGVRTYTCGNCGETRTETIETGEHRYESAVTEATCTKGGFTTHTCAICGDSYTDSETKALGHNWNGGEMTTEPSCVQSGEKTFHCTRCNAVKTVAVSATGHQWDEGKVTKNATCTDSGQAIYTCACGATKTAAVPALGHAWGEGEITKAATCTEDGVKKVACTRSGCGKTGTQAIPALGHDYEIVTADSSCTVTGGVTYTCAVCGDSYTEGGEEAPGHVWDEGQVTAEATCTEAGEMTYICTVCGETETEEIPKTGHRFEDGVCEYCGEAEEISEAPEEEDSGMNSAVIMFIVMIGVIALVLNRLKIFK